MYKYPTKWRKQDHMYNIPSLKYPYPSVKFKVIFKGVLISHALPRLNVGEHATFPSHARINLRAHSLRGGLL